MDENRSLTDTNRQNKNVWAMFQEDTLLRTVRKTEWTGGERMEDRSAAILDNMNSNEVEYEHIK